MKTGEPDPGDLSGGPTVAVTDRSGQPDLDISRWTVVAEQTLRAENVVTGHLDLTFVAPVEMAELNREHMGHEGPTDVLSFPLDDGFDGDDHGNGPASPPVLLGDVVICPQVAQEQAPEHSGDIDTELTLLVVHGVLHILGHDHADPDEEAAMIAREAVHLGRHGMSHPGPARPEPPR